MKLSDFAILNIKDSGYCCIVTLISKNKAINLICQKKWNIIKHQSLLLHQIFTFEHIEIEKNEFCRKKTPILRGNVDIEKGLVSKKSSIVEKNCKYIIGYRIMIIKLNHYTKCFLKQAHM